MKGMFLKIAFMLVVAAVTLFNAKNVLALPLYDVIGIGYVQPADINNSGQVIGDYSSYYNQSFIWTREGGMKNIGGLFGYGSSAYAINDFGQVVGRTYIESGGRGHAFLYENGIMTDIDPNSWDSYASSINNAGDIVGFSTNFWGGVLWRNGVQTKIAEGWATDINNFGQVVGHPLNWGSLINHAFLWSESTGITDIGSFGGPTSADAINDFGVVVGSSSITSDFPFNYHAYIYTEHTGMIDLGIDSSYAADINNSGQVVGYVYPYFDPTALRYAFAYENDTFYNLNDRIHSDSGWVLYRATAINDRGQIIGMGSFNGEENHGYLLTPIPEPSSLMLLSFGLLGTGLFRRRR